MTQKRLTKASVRAWLEDHYRLTPGELDCIMTQDDWKYIDARTEMYMGQRSGENSVEQDFDDATAFALSALVECHDSPHIAGCPYYREEVAR